MMIDSPTEAEIAALPAAPLDAAVAAAFRLLSAGRLLNPPRRSRVDAVGYALDMPATLLDESGRPLVEGLKRIRETVVADAVGARALGQRTAELRLLHVPTGRRLTLPANTITDRRTGVAAALAIAALAGPIERLAVIGTGRVAREAARAADRLLRPRAIRATSRTVRRCAEFEALLAGELAAEVQAAPGLAAALTGADAVIAAVPSPTPLLTSELAAAIPVIVAIEGDPRACLLEASLLTERALLVDQPDQAAETGSVAALAAAPAWSDLAQALAEGRSKLWGRPVTVLLTGLAGLDLLVGWEVWRLLGDRPK